jgi:hypothetical protein
MYPTTAFIRRIHRCGARYDSSAFTPIRASTSKRLTIKASADILSLQLSATGQG